MNYRIRALMFAAALVCACSSISKNQSTGEFPYPPSGLAAPGDNEPVAVDHTLEKALRANPSEEMRFLVRYRQARLWSPVDPAKACALWLEIAKNPRFPLNRIAALHAVETCPAGRSEVASYFLELQNAEHERWMREAAYRAALTRAIKEGDRAVEMNMAIRVAPFLPTQSEQLGLISRAKALADELGDSSVGAFAEQEVVRRAPRLIPDPAPEKYMAVAADFRRAREFEKAREYYRKIAKGDGFTDLERLRALDGIRMTFKLERDMDRYIRATRDYSDFARARFFASRGTRNFGKYLETRLTLARAVWTENSPSEARSILRKIETELKGRHPLDESIFLRARIEEEAGRVDRALRLLGRIDDKRISDITVRHRLRWYRAWNLRKVGRHSAAIRVFSNLVSEETSPPLIARNRFWLGRTYMDAGKAEKANSEFRWLIENDPIGYYGTLAYRELELPLPALSPLSPTQPVILRAPAAALGAVAAGSGVIDSTLPLQPNESLTFEWLVATGERDLGRRYLDQLGVVKRTGYAGDNLLEALQLYARAGAYHSLFARLTDVNPEMRKRILEQRPELIFPRPWLISVESASKNFAVPAPLIYSIMRQESSFNPKVRSIADAMGLMQLIPIVANDTARSIGEDLEYPEKLYDPDLNIRLGAAHLRDLLKKWEGRFIPAVASYNASEKAVAGWLRTRDRRDPLQFIEDIPYEETRGYVKLVLRNFIFYSRLAANTPSVEFPEWCLEGLQDVKP